MAKADDWLARYRARMERQKEHSERLVEYLVPALRFLGVTFVSIEFDGYGDEGEVQGAVFEGAPAAGPPEGLASCVKSACEMALPGGWEVNAGSFGTWGIDVEKGTSDLEVTFRDKDDIEEEDEG